MYYSTNYTLNAWCVQHSPPTSKINVVSYLVATLVLLSVLGLAHHCTVKPFLPSFLSCHSREKRYQALSSFSVLQAMESLAMPGNRGNFLIWSQYLYLGSYSVYRSGEKSQPTEHIGERVHFLFNDCCYKCSQKTYSLLCSIPCTKHVLSAETPSLSNMW